MYSGHPWKQPMADGTTLNIKTNYQTVPLPTTLININVILEFKLGPLKLKCMMHCHQRSPLTLTICSQ